MQTKSATTADQGRPRGENDVASPEWARYVTPPSGYRLPDATRLGRVRLEIADLPRSLAFYEQVLGLRVIEREKGRATLGAHGDDATLVELDEVPGATPVPRRGRLGLYHFAILLPAREALGRFLAHLGRVGASVGASDHSVSEALYLNDPDGLGIEVYADRPRPDWRVFGNSLELTTDPLDMADVVRAGGNAPWTGMPAGTTIGHVHLHVGDLPAATRFFHDSLGLDIVTALPGAVFLSAGGYHHHLGANTWAAGAARPERGDARLLNWTVVVPGSSDAEAAAQSIEAAGHSVARTEGGWRAQDPWGTTLEIVGESEAG